MEQGANLRTSLDAIRADFENHDWYLAAIVPVDVTIDISPIREYSNKKYVIVTPDRVRCLLTFHMPDYETIKNGIIALSGWLEYPDGEYPLKVDVIDALSIPDNIIPDTVTESIIFTHHTNVHIFMIHPSVDPNEVEDHEEGSIWDYLEVEIKSSKADEQDDSKQLIAVITPEYIADNTTTTDVEHARLPDVIKALKLDTHAEIWECEDA